MMKPKILKTEIEYENALNYLESLMDAIPGSDKEQELELWALLIERYEDEHFPIELPDPIDAIKFRMDQEGLSRKDLEKFIGSQSKVSEVLNRKTPLSVSMIRALHKGLGIPAEVLLNTNEKKNRYHVYSYRDYPFTEMYNRGYFTSFNGTLSEAKNYADDLLGNLFSNIPSISNQQIYCRNSDNDINESALRAWQAKVLEISSNKNLPEFKENEFDVNIIKEMVKLSSYSTGPLLAKEFLEKHGIPLIYLKHLPKTYLDGACFADSSGRPVIGMTFRHDRLDNFWFTLVHELAHICLHFDDGCNVFFDDTEKGSYSSKEPKEIEANELTRNLLISTDCWVKIKDDLLFTSEDFQVKRFADQIGISPSIIAGRIRWESKDYTKFNSLIGNKKVRNLFTLNI